MTERSLGSNFKWFMAKVVNRGDGKEGKKDPTQSGRVQIRIFGKHDDEKNIPDDKLPWAVPLLPVGTGASKEGVGGSPVGLKKGSTVVGFYADKDETMPILFGVLHKAGTDKGDDGTEVETKNNDVPKGARTQETGGGDKNDVLKKRLTEDVAKEGQHHKDKKTIGDVPFQGEPVLEAIKKIDPNNAAGAIPGALNGMKSMVNTLGVAGLLLANFKALTTGKTNITNVLAAVTNVSAVVAQNTTGSVSQFAGAVNQVAAMSYVQSFGGVPVNMVVNGNQGVTAKFGNVVININNKYDTRGNIISTNGVVISNGVVIGSGNMAQVAIIVNGLSPQAQKILAGIQAVSMASNLVANAFGIANPLETVLNGLGGITGLNSLAAKANGLLGPLTQNFGAATAIANNLRNQTQMVFAGLQPAPFRPAGSGEIAKVLQNIANIAGIISMVSRGGAIYAGNVPIIPAVAGAIGQALNIPPSLLNSAIQIPLTSLSVINALNRRNPGVSIGFNPGISAIPARVAPRRTYVSPTIIRPITYTNPAARISSLTNSVVSVNIPILNTQVVYGTINSTPGIGYNVSGIGIRF